MYDLLTTEEAGSVLGVSARRIRQLVAAGALSTAGTRPGGAILVERAGIERYRAVRPRRRGPRAARNTTHDVFLKIHDTCRVSIDNTTATR